MLKTGKRLLVGALLCSTFACAGTNSGNTHAHGGPVTDAWPGHVDPSTVVASTPAPEPAPAAEPAAPAPAAAPTEFAETLPSGVAIKGNLDGIEAKLVAFIKDDARAVDKTTWFSFDRLLFQTGKADLDMETSKDQLTNITEILKAYPKVTIKVGGYTDNVGNAKSNLTLSQKRADNVAAALVAMGIDAKRLSPEGYGQEHPVCAANDTDACKAQNRRIDVRVSAK